MKTLPRAIDGRQGKLFLRQRSVWRHQMNPSSIYHGFFFAYQTLCSPRFRSLSFKMRSQGLFRILMSLECAYMGKFCIGTILSIIISWLSSKIQVDVGQTCNLTKSIPFRLRLWNLKLWKVRTCKKQIQNGGLRIRITGKNAHLLGRVLTWFRLDL